MPDICLQSVCNVCSPLKMVQGFQQWKESVHDEICYLLVFTEEIVDLVKETIITDTCATIGELCQDFLHFQGVR